MARILIVDDEKGMRDALKAILQESRHSVTEADDGRTAQDILQKNEFDLVVSDLQMPHVNGIELLSWIKSRSRTPVILVTAFSHILETQKAYELGASDFLTKPFGKEEIVQSIDKVLGLKTAAPSNSANEENLYCRIPIEDFVSDTGVQINIYVRLSEKKYVRVAHKGDHVPTERVENYKSKGLHYLYAKKEEFARLVGFNVDLSKAIAGRSSISQEKKLRFMQYTSELILEHVAVNGVDEDALRQASDCITVCLSMLTDSESLFELLETIGNHGDWIYRHSLGVGMYSVMIGRKMGWSSQSTMFKLGVGGLLHDIGEKEIDIEILLKARPMLSLEERKVFETHPTRGKQILQELNELPNDIVQIVYEHHEDLIGQGFPRQLKREKIHPLAKVIKVADQFCSIAIPNPRSKGCGARDAIEKMQEMLETGLDQKAFLALSSLCTQGAKR